jgi:hypothetical protein
VRTIRWALVVALCSIALLAAKRALVVDPIDGIHPTTDGGNSLDPRPAPPAQVAIAAPDATLGPTTFHAPAPTRMSADRSSLRWLPGVSPQSLISHRRDRHLVAIPLLI